MSDAIVTVREVIKSLKRFSPDAKVVFSVDEESPGLYTHYEADSFHDLVIIRPDGEGYNESEIRSDMVDQLLKKPKENNR